MNGAFLAIDWGTTNRRVYLIEEGRVVHTERDDAGAMRTTDFAGEMAALRAKLGDLPAVMAGMVGSNVGWRTVPYVSAPAGLAELAAALTFIDERTAIVPGLAVDQSEGRPDIMRGEEVQLLGGVASGVVPADAMLCQPGTHCKWAWIVGGRITGFVTAMTGEIYGLLGSHSLLAPMLRDGTHNHDAFCAGVREGSERDLAAALFSVRARVILGGSAAQDAASWTSGLLIGAEVAARLAQIGDRTIHILADAHMGGLYATAIETLGGSARLVDSHAAFVAGISAIWDMR